MDLVKYGMTEFVFEVMLIFVLQLARFAAKDGPAKERLIPVKFSSGPYKERKVVRHLKNI